MNRSLLFVCFLFVSGSAFAFTYEVGPGMSYENIVFQGVPGSGGDLPVIDGRNAGSRQAGLKRIKAVFREQLSIRAGWLQVNYPDSSIRVRRTSIWTRIRIA